MTATKETEILEQEGAEVAEKIWFRFGLGRILSWRRTDSVLLSHEQSINLPRCIRISAERQGLRVGLLVQPSRYTAQEFQKEAKEFAEDATALPVRRLSSDDPYFLCELCALLFKNFCLFGCGRASALSCSK